MLYYTVFRTQWGYFGLAGCDDAVWRTSLPEADREATLASGRKVLRACRNIPHGQTATYGALAARVGSPAAARAVGGAMAANPIPLIIPCHRVLRADGGLGGFSTTGGTATKQRLLQHERLTCAAPAP